MNSRINEPYVAVILVNYKCADDTLRCIGSITEQTYKNYMVVVVDNDSEDRIQAALLETFPDVIFCKSEVNRGFAAGCNVGIREAQKHHVDYYLLINPDTVVDSSLLTELVNCAERDQNSGIVGAKIYFLNDPKRIWKASAQMNMILATDFGKGTEKLDRDEAGDIIECTHVTGCCHLIKKKVIETIGLLDETYFMYYEDTDFDFRARKAGFKILYCPSAVLWHDKKRREAKKPDYYFILSKSCAIFIRKNIPPVNRPFAIVYNLCYRLLEVLYHCKTLGFSGLWCVMRGFAAGLGARL